MNFSAAALGRTLRDYQAHIRLFGRNARLYLTSIVITGVAMGVFRLLFNFFVISRGFDEALLGNLVTTSSLTSLVLALPMGYLADMLGRKRSLMLSTVVTSLAVVLMVAVPQVFSLYAGNVLLGMAQGLAAVSMSPFLVENSGERERTYLFSFSAGMQMAAGSVGNWLGGLMPTWVGSRLAIDAMSSTAYGGSLLLISALAAVGMVPLAFMVMPKLTRLQRSVFAPVTYARLHPQLLGKLVFPMLITSLGAGMIMPFMNVFFRQQYGQPDPTIGALFAWGSLSMGIGLLVAPPLADRMGKIQFVVITQALSIPFLILLGFAPWFWLSTVAYLVRVALMNMSGPIYQSFVMERVEGSARATVASLVSMAWNFGWAFSPTISGLLQVRYGFGPSFMVTIVLYSVSTLMYWAFFWRAARSAAGDPSADAGRAPQQPVAE
jgi:MFS family permease